MISNGSVGNGPEKETPEQEATSKGSEKEGPNPVEELQTKVQEAEKKYLYLYSEFENFRRRNERERLDFLKFGHESFLKELLQVMDNFERALAHAKSLGGEKGSPLAQVIQGIEMIHYQYAEALRGQGVNPVAAMGQKFDPSLHEAVGEEEAEAEPGTVVREAQKGYLLHGRLLRPARVVVAKKV
ncbi:MAG TPA: nucleotide exchange factor GrpE [Bdellovibrionota bacterium]|jgi:molecular chaperone GrpE